MEFASEVVLAKTSVGCLPVLRLPELPARWAADAFAFCRRPLRMLAVGVLVLPIVAGCASFRSYQTEIGRTLDLVAVGRIDSAIKAHRGQTHYGEDLLYYLEQGELLRLGGRYAESQTAWFEADRRFRKWEEQARVEPEMLARDVGSLLVSDRLRAYTGHDFEKVMLTTRMALNHLSLGEWDQARVAIKRSHEREALIARLRAEQVRRAEESAGEKDEAPDFRELNGYPVRTIDNPEVNALRNSYQNAFSHYLAGFVYEALGEISLAAAGYRQAIELQPGLALLEEGLAGLDMRHFRRSRSVTEADGTTDLLLVIETGLAPARASVNINLPVPTDQGLLLAPVSFPVIREQRLVSGSSAVSTDEGMPTEASTVTSVDLMSRRALQDEMPWIMVRAVARATAKASIQRVAFKKDDSNIAGTVVLIGSVLTERADERGWRSLPAKIGLARFRLAHGTHDVDVAVGSQKHRFSVSLDGPFAVMSVRQVGTAAYMSLSPGPGA
jgi:hypothetical protein